MEMMNAAVLRSIGDLRYERVPKPERRPGEVLIRVMACGVCGSDIPRVYEKGTYRFPTIPGHEFSGLIVETDEEHKELVGRRAAVFPLIPCRVCQSCEIGEYANCSDYDYYGSRRDGAFAEYISVDERNLILMPDSLSYACASLAEPGAVARAAVRRMEVGLGDTAVVFGAGPIGLIAAQWLKKAGAGCVRIVDISDEKIAFAEKFGFLPYDKSRDGRADCVLEGTGASAALGNAILALKPKGRLVLMGNPAQDMTISQSTYSQILRREIIMRGTWNSSYNRVINDWAETVSAMASGEIKYEELITHRYPLSKINEALGMMRGRREFYTKVTITNE